MEKLVIEEGVTAISDGAFRECRLLKSAVFPNSVTTMGESIFFQCSELTSVVLPSSLEVIPQGIFYSCKKLTSVSIPESVKEISATAFAGCNSLPFVNIPEGVVSIGFNAFYVCSSLKSIIIPRSVISIGFSAFSGCSNLTSIQVEDGNPNYDSRQNCNAIIEKSREKLIAGCKTTTIPSDITTIGGSAFYGCDMESISIPDNIKYIEAAAFQRCTKLKSINLSKNVISIGEQAFLYCKNLEKIVIEDGNYRYDSRDNCNVIIDKSSHTLILGCKNSIIPQSVITIGKYAFEGSGIKNVTIPNSVTGIEEGAFAYCDDLETVFIPNSVTSISTDVFAGCTNLREVNIPEGIYSIPSRMFTSCKSLSSVEIPSNIISIGKNVFMSSGLSSINIPNSVSRLYGSCFSDCNNLTEITIPSSVTKMDIGGVRGCKNLKKVIIMGKPYIDDLNFAYCESLADIYCYSEEVPTFNGIFLNTPAESMTLHVPASAIDKYKSTSPWNSIGNIVPLTDGDPQQTSILSGNNPLAKPVSSYDFKGRKIYSQREGLTIQRMSDGSVRKIVMKK